MESTIPCPLCQSTMPERAFGATRVHTCESGCGGLWFRARDLETLDTSSKGIGPHLERALNATPVPAHPDRTLKCPSCACDLQRRLHHLAPEVELDLCPTCFGVFLDAGEFAVLRQRTLTRRELSEDHAKRKRRYERQKRMIQAREANQGDSFFDIDIWD